ncbi:hypothetical protein L0152_16930 [bacterium]|nr:hypothetical protein [bacterium]
MKTTKLLAPLIVLMFVSIIPLKANSCDPEILKSIAKQIEENNEHLESYDFYQDQEVKELDDGGSVKKVKKQTFRTRRLLDHRYFELIKVDGKDLNDKERKDEAKRRGKFIKEIQKKGKASEEEEDGDKDFTLADLMEKYDFSQLPAEGEAVYVISFKPKSGKLKERNRTERILNHLEGRFWVTADYNLMRADARLMEPVKYGLGIIANVQNVDLKYQQTRFDGIWVPESFALEYKARVVVKDQIKKVHSRYFNLTKRPAAAPSAATK